MKNFKFTLYPFSQSQVAERIAQYSQQTLQFFDEQTALRFMLNCIDLTTLEGADNTSKIEDLCNKAKSFKSVSKKISNPASVCVYPPFVAQAKKMLHGSGVRVASVAGAFPSGQSPLFVKLAEVKYAVDEGADDIDMVISRGKFLESNYEEVSEEIVAIKKVCHNTLLKVIIETGELKSFDNIYNASRLAIDAGADFIKTSTGKVPVNATPESFLVMIDTIKEYYDHTGIMIGMKPAGGISDAETALLYLKILENVLGEKWLTNHYFRIGASRLADKIYERIL